MNRSKGVARLITRINDFLKDRKESVKGGYSEVTHDEMTELFNIFADIIMEKWARDADGDHPVEFVLTDRTRFNRPVGKIPVRYIHKATSEPEMADIISAAVANASSSMAFVHNLWQQYFEHKFNRSARA